MLEQSSNRGYLRSTSLDTTQLEDQHATSFVVWRLWWHRSPPGLDWSGIDEAGAGAGGAGGVGGAGGEARRWNSTPRGIEGAMGRGWEGITSEAAIRIHSSLSSPPSSPSIQIAHASGQLLLTPPAANASIAGSSGTAGSTHDSTHAPQIRLTSFSRPPSSSSSSSSSAVPPPSSSSSGPPGGEGGSRQLNRRILEVLGPVCLAALASSVCCCR
eukprot:1646904-Rhodomonas_salina.1